jgi:demethylmenaquinone methyltransferase/2-methoxy-6-polyprenyl-1,4-benzoquinol methylase
MSGSFPGTRPRHTHNEEEAARWVRHMFDRVAPRYDLLNHLLSFQLDRWWRARTVRRLRPIMDRADARIVDLCCGSGDLLLAMRKRSSSVVHGSDFSHNMLLAASRKIHQERGVPSLFEADALQLPFAVSSLDLVTAAFGFRNFANYRAGLEELLRVLKPGGTAAILEFSTPPNRLFRSVYRLYFRTVLPWVGGVVSGSPEAYEYLPESVDGFPGAEQLAEDMRAAGFRHVSFEHMTGGVVALHVAVK